MNEIREFFTPSVQYDLIQTAQMQSETFEDALKKYCQGFVCSLTDILVKNDRKLGKYKSIAAIKEFIGLMERDGVNDVKRYSFEDCITTKFFSGVLECYNNWINCLMCEAISVIEEQIQQILLPDSEVNEIRFDPNNATRFYRGRISQIPLGIGDMFHIKFKELHKIRNQRFSLVGQPLLYLGASIQCVAEEMSINPMHQGQIEQLFVSQYTMIENNQDAPLLPLFDMRLYIQDSFFEEETNDELRKKQFVRFLLSCICSFNNYHNYQNAHFIEEYIIPQLVIQEIRKYKYYSGVCYYSTRFIPEEENMRLKTIKIGRTRATVSDDRPIRTIYSAAENYAFFTNRPSNRDEPWDGELKRKFDITMPVSISELRRNSISFQGSEDDLLSFADGVKLLEDYFRMRDAQEKNLTIQEWYGAYQLFSRERYK